LSSPSRLSDYLGSSSQNFGIEHFTEQNGPGHGSRRIRAYTGGGLEFDIHPDRAFDIGRTTFRGINLSWLSPTRITAPGLVVNDREEWLRTFGGGLLTTCGLDAIGDPSVTDGQRHPMHGRIGAVPATLTRATVDHDNLELEAEIRQTSVHGENLVLVRRITAPIGGTSIRVTDRVTNEGSSDSPHMVLYHCNFGWPLIDETVRITVPSIAVTPENEAASRAPQPWDRFETPSPDAESLVYRHHFADEPIVTARIENFRAGISVAISFDRATLPSLHQWKMMAPRQYLLGVEPSNTSTLKGRAAAEAMDAVPVLRSGESVSYELIFEFEELHD
jgi:Domain of unknown function (DUF4432)